MAFSKIFLISLTINLLCFGSTRFLQILEDPVIQFQALNNSTAIPNKLNNVLMALNGFANSSGLYNSLPTLDKIKDDEYVVLQKVFEVYDIFKNITKDSFVDIMIKGSSTLSELFSREAEVVSNSTHLG